MTDEQIKYMRDRFLSWTLPRTLNPDGGITFKRSESAIKYNHPWPVGTNFLNAEEAEVMVRHMIEGLPIRNQEDDNRLQQIAELAPRIMHDDYCAVFDRVPAECNCVKSQIQGIARSGVESGSGLAREDAQRLARECVTMHNPQAGTVTFDFLIPAIADLLQRVAGEDTRLLNKLETFTDIQIWRNQNGKWSMTVEDDPKTLIEADTIRAAIEGEKK